MGNMWTLAYVRNTCSQCDAESTTKLKHPLPGASNPSLASKTGLWDVKDNYLIIVSMFKS